MIIRNADTGDIKVLQDLNDEVFIDNAKYDPDIKTDWAQSEAGKKYFINVINDPDAVCLIAEENSVAIGYILGSRMAREYCKSKYFEIENMGVHPDYRSKGIGSKLMDNCLKITKEKGFQKVYVNVYIKNEKAVNFYKKYGYNEIDVCLDKTI